MDERTWIVDMEQSRGIPLRENLLNLTMISFEVLSEILKLLGRLLKTIKTVEFAVFSLLTMCLNLEDAPLFPVSSPNHLGPFNVCSLRLHVFHERQSAFFTNIPHPWAMSKCHQSLGNGSWS